MFEVPTSSKAPAMVSSSLQLILILNSFVWPLMSVISGGKIVWVGVSLICYEMLTCFPKEILSRFSHDGDLSFSIFVFNLDVDTVAENGMCFPVICQYGYGFICLCNECVKVECTCSRVDQPSDPDSNIGCFLGPFLIVPHARYHHGMVSITVPTVVRRYSGLLCLNLEVCVSIL